MKKIVGPAGYVRKYSFLLACFLIVMIASFAQASAKRDFSILANRQSQEQKTIEPLSIGDKLPPGLLGSILRYSSDKISTQDLAGKAVLFDFFATWCTPCIAAFPTFDSLQQEFGDKLKIILITYEDKATVEKFLTKNRVASSVSIPLIYADTLLRAYFPLKMVPHEVWLDSKATVKAITTPLHVTKENLQLLTEGKDLNLPIKKDNIDFDGHKYLFADGNGASASNIRYRFTVTGYLDGLPGVRGMDYLSKDQNLVSRFYDFNSPILTLYKDAIVEISDFPDNRFILNVKDKSKYTLNGQVWDSWKWDNTYCFELITEPTTPAAIREMMVKNLNEYFHLSVNLQKVNTPCYIISTSRKNKVAKTKGGETENNLYERDKKDKFLNNEPVSALVRFLNFITDTPVIDETGLAYNVDLKLNIDTDNINIESLKQQLSKYGITLEKADRNIEMFTITENEN